MVFLRFLIVEHTCLLGNYKKNKTTKQLITQNSKLLIPHFQHSELSALVYTVYLYNESLKVQLQASNELSMNMLSVICNSMLFD